MRACSLRPYSPDGIGLVLTLSLVLVPAGASRVWAQSSADTLVVTSTATPEEETPRQIGGGVSAPVLVSHVDPEYSEEARKDKISGTVLVGLWVDAEGMPTHIKVVRGVGHGLDEKAVDAIQQYRFKPALENGKPVTVMLNVQVNFQIYKDKKDAQQAGTTAPTGAAPVSAPRVLRPSDTGREIMNGQITSSQELNGQSPSAQTASGLQVRSAPTANAAPGAAPAQGLTDGQRAMLAASGLKTAADRQRYLDDPKFAKAIDEARQGRMTTDERLARWKHANKLADNQCVLCLHTILTMQVQAAQWKDATASARQLDQISPDPREKFFAESEIGVTLSHANGDKPKPEQLEESLAALKSALALGQADKAIAAASRNTLYTEGRVLAMLNRDDEARAAFQKYVDMVGYSDSYRTRAEHFVENPRLAAMPMAPPFTLTTSEGEQLSLDDMHGKVVLLDFWATWCGPCKETLPEIQRIAHDFAGQPLVVISISSDRDETAWKQFVVKNHMDWPQYRDANGALNSAYGVSSIPRFFTIDTDGVLQSVKVGSGADVSGDIRRLVGKARDAEKKKARASETAQAGE